MKFWHFINTLDRRWIFLLVALAVLIPFLFPLGLPIRPTPPVKQMFNAIDSIKPGDGPILIGADYDPSTMPELQPMLKAILRHCFAKNIPVLIVSMFPQGIGMAQAGLSDVLQEFPDKKAGVDYVIFGYVPGVSAVMLKMGESIKSAFPEDAEGRSTADMPILKNVNTYDDIPYFVDLSGSSITQSWIMYANARYGQRMGVGTTAVSAAEYYTFLQTGQLIGMLGGLKGAAEYERLLKEKGYSNARMEATIGMDAQSMVHILIIILIILGNIAYFVERKAINKR